MSVDTHCAVYGKLMAVCFDMDILTSNYMLLLILSASSFTDNFSMYICVHMFGGCIASVAVEKLVSAFLLCANHCHI